jgi:hypothetical protein
MKRIVGSVLVVLLGASICFSGEKEDSAYLNAVYKTCTTKCASKYGTELYECWKKYTPEKCKEQVYNLSSGGWSRCVMSCGSAGYFSRNFGECSN